MKGRMDLPREDLKAVAEVFERLLNHLHVKLELYYARFVQDDPTQVEFEPILKS